MTTGSREPASSSIVFKTGGIERFNNNSISCGDAVWLIAARNWSFSSVKPEKISDDQMTILARDVAKKVENEMDYPGQIKVNIIRETRVVDYAK